MPEMPIESVELPVGMLYELITTKLTKSDEDYEKMKEAVHPHTKKLAQQLFDEVQSRVETIIKHKYCIEIVELSAFGQHETDKDKRGFCSLFAAANPKNLSTYKNIVQEIQICNEEKNIGPLVPETAFYNQQDPFFAKSKTIDSNKTDSKATIVSSDIEAFLGKSSGGENIESETIHGRFQNFIRICSERFKKNIVGCAVPYLKDFRDDDVKTGGAIFLICSTESPVDDCDYNLLKMSTRLLLLAQLVAAKHANNTGGVQAFVQQQIFNKLFPATAIHEKWFGPNSVVPHGFDNNLNEKLKRHIEAVLDKNAWLYQHAIATQKNELHEILKRMVGSFASCHDDDGSKGFGLNQIAIVAAAYFEFPEVNNFQFSKEIAILGKGTHEDSKKTMKSLTDMFYALSLKKSDEKKVEIKKVELSDTELCITFCNFPVDNFLQKQKTNEKTGDLTKAISEFAKYSRFSLDDANKESITTYCVLDNEREADNEIKFKFRSV